MTFKPDPWDQYRKKIEERMAKHDKNYNPMSIQFGEKEEETCGNCRFLQKKKNFKIGTPREWDLHCQLAAYWSVSKRLWNQDWIACGKHQEGEQEVDVTN